MKRYVVQVIIYYQYINMEELTINIIIGIFVIIVATFPFSMAMIVKFGVEILDKLWKN